MPAELLADIQLGNNCTIALDVFLGKIIKQTAAFTNHLIHTETAVIIIGMTLQMLSELADALSQNSNLNFGRTGIILMCGVLTDDLSLHFFRNHANTSFLNKSIPSNTALGGKEPLLRHYPKAVCTGERLLS